MSNVKEFNAVEFIGRFFDTLFVVVWGVAAGVLLERGETVFAVVIVAILFYLVFKVLSEERLQKALPPEVDLSGLIPKNRNAKTDDSN